MSKKMQVMMVVLVAWMVCPALGGVEFYRRVEINSEGNPIMTIGATSYSDPISSLGIHIWPIRGGKLGQVHPWGGVIPTHLTDNNVVIEASGMNVDQDTQALFNTGADGLLVVAGHVDTEDEFNINFTGFEPFYSRDIVQVVVTSWACDCDISAVAGGVQYYSSGLLCNPPEPASLGMLVLGAIAVMRRR